MIKQNVFIINFNSLYEILDEIKENLSFKIIKCDSEEAFTEESDLDIKNSLFISKFSQKLLLNKNLSEKKFLDFNKFNCQQIKLIKLISKNNLF